MKRNNSGTKRQPLQTQESQQEIIRIGKDEMNLVEYPFALLRRESKPGAIIEQQWEAEHPVTGRLVKAKWRVEGSPQLGLPTATDERIFLVLMELTREADFAQEIYFTRHNLVKRLQWEHCAPSYKKIIEAFRRLTAVTISAENAFWNPEAKVFHNRGFHILESYDIVSERAGRKRKDTTELPLSHFRWSKEMMESFHAGYIRTIDLNTALTLNLPIALRLYRYLDKKKHDGKGMFEIELRRLCEIHLGMTTAKHMSTLKVRLQPAHEELIAQGFLKSATYHPMRTRKSEKVCYIFPTHNQLPSHKAIKSQQLNTEIPDSTEKVNPGSLFDKPLANEEHSGKVNTQLTAHQPNQTTQISPLLQRLTDIGVSSSVAQEIYSSFSHEQISLHLDCLADREPKNPPATLVTALRQDWAPPSKYFERLEAAQNAKRSEEATEAQKRAKDAQKAAEREKRATQEHEATMFNAMWDKLDDRTRQRIDLQVRKKLEANDFLRARLEAGKLTEQSPDWMQARYALLREMLGQTTTSE